MKDLERQLEEEILRRMGKNKSAEAPVQVQRVDGIFNVIPLPEIKAWRAW